MKFKQKFKQMISSYSFWTALAGALAFVASAIGRAFSIKVEEQIVTDIVMGVAGVLVTVGIVSMPANKTAQAEEQKDSEKSQQNSSVSQSDKTEQSN